jgi:hypothetical protein
MQNGRLGNIYIFFFSGKVDNCQRRMEKMVHYTFFSVLGQRQVESSDIAGCLSNCFGTSSSDMYLYYIML